MNGNRSLLMFAFLLEECLRYLGLCTFSHSPFCDVILALFGCCQSNCSLSSLAAEIVLMEFCDWMKTSVEDVFFEFDATSPRCLVLFFRPQLIYMRILISAYCETFCAQLRLSFRQPLA